METTWFKIAEIAKKLGLAENTARRYANFFEEFLNVKKYRNTKKYDEKSIETISKIAGLYDDGYGTEEIREIMKKENPQTVDVVKEERSQYNSTTISPELFFGVLVQASQAMEQLINNNIEMRNKIDQLEKKIENRDRQIMYQMRLLQYQNLPWWKKLFTPMPEPPDVEIKNKNHEQLESQECRTKND